jgi:hypothetical protein
MRVTMNISIKPHTAKRETARVFQIIQAKTTVAAAIRAYHLSLSKVGLGRGYEADDGELVGGEPVEN